MPKTTIKRPIRLSFRVSKAESQLIRQQADDRGLKLSDYIRQVLFDTIFKRNGSDSIGSEVMTEISKIQELFTQLKDKEFDMNMILQNLANQSTPLELSLEDQIRSHLHGRQLFLNQIALYCQASPAQTLQTLAKMKQNGTVDQTAQKRWYLQ